MEQLTVPLSALNQTLSQRLGEALVQKGFLKPADLERALDIQARTGERLGRILITLNLVRRQQLYQVLSELWDYPFVDLQVTHVSAGVARRFDPKLLIQRNFVPIARHGDVVDVATADCPSETLTLIIRSVLGPVSVCYQVTTEWDTDYAIRSVFRSELLDQAIHGPYRHNSRESAYTVMTSPQFVMLGFALLAGLFGLYLAPRQVLTILNLLVNIGFLFSILFKFAVALAGARHERPEAVTDEEVKALRDSDLPTYTILLPVYREANIVEMLVKNLCSLDYPQGKLEILLLLEENDKETIEAARAVHPPEMVTFVIIPNGQPKTKPKACNVGLFFARGEYLVIYDAEDRPEPDQLKKAVVAFRKGPPNLVCVQAALNYFNAEENLLTRMFTLEYSYWFDYMLPGLDRLRLPIPLGGTSNHFRTDMLRKLGGWDPFNVTEDADLGIRASANGYTVTMINSTTYEEANNHVGNWIRQRSRWIKGYMQTSLIHLRDPFGMVKRIGWRNTLGFIMLIAGTPLTFLCALPLWVLFIISSLTRIPALGVLFPPIIFYIGLFNLLIGNQLMIYLNMLGVFKRRTYGLVPFTLLNPLYWVLHAIAAYKALWQLFTKPFFWEKTVHGISRKLAPPVPAGVRSQPVPN
jgi:hypothetical protein